MHTNEDFFIREALAKQIAKYPHGELLEVTQKLSNDKYQQVARYGKIAKSKIIRLKLNK